MKKEDQKSKKPNSSKREESNQKRKDERSSSVSVPQRKDQGKQVGAKAPLKKSPEKKKEKGPTIGEHMAKAGQFLREARTELKKVKWPTRKELMASTAVVIVLVLVVSFFLGIVDFGLIKIIKNIVG